MSEMASAQMKLDAVERELAMRRRVYPKFVEGAKMSAKFADEQILIFEEIAEDYRRQVESERLL